MKSEELMANSRGESGMRLQLGRRSRLFWIFAGVVAVSSFPSGAAAGERAIIMPDGRRVPLVRSATELALRFDRLDDVAPCALRLRHAGAGEVVNLPNLPDSRFKLLKMPNVTVRRRSLARRDPAIREVRPVYRLSGVNDPLISSGTVVVKLRAGLDEAQRHALWTAYRVEVVKAVEGLDGVYLVKPLDDDEDEVLRAEVLAVDRRTVWAQPNFRQRLERRQIVPGDQFFSQQWHLNNVGQDGGKPGADIAALDAWIFSQGQDVLFGMFDDACDVDHEDLFANFTGVGHDPSLESTDPGFTDPRPKDFGDRHGTAVMGLAVAASNAVGGRGVSFLSRFTVSRGLAELLTNEQVAGVFTFARQQNVDIHINSWGFPVGTVLPSVVVDAINTAFREGRDIDGDGGALPLGMIVVFASGNGLDGEGAGIELQPGDDLSTLNTVLGVGASNNQDVIAGFSNFGVDIDFLAPGGEFSGLVTTDNDEAFVFVEGGFNVGGTTLGGGADIDPNGLYTANFQGTSAACPVAAGVAGLILSANRQLSATNVRVIMEHTCDRINPDQAEYNNVSSRSLTYGHGRLNADRAVQAAFDAIFNGGRTWPEPAQGPRVLDADLTWDAATGTREFIIVQSSGPFTFTNADDDRFPVDGECYSTDQFGCGGEMGNEIVPLPPGMSLTDIVTCDGTCAVGVEQSITGVMSAAGISYAVYARSGIGRYSWGIEAFDAGLNPGPVDPGTGPPVRGPDVSIMTSPPIPEGVSPLTVNFAGNALRTELDIDESRTRWDFDIDDGNTVDATTRNASHVYIVPTGQTRTFIARLEMFDVEGNRGFDQITVRVEGSEGSGDVGEMGQSDVRIVVGTGTVDSDVDLGTSPFRVELSIDASTLPGRLESVSWDLGDGATATSLVVPNTYINETNPPQTLRFPVTAGVTVRLPSNLVQTLTATRVITVLPGAASVETPDCIVLPGAGVGDGDCGATTGDGTTGDGTTGDGTTGDGTTGGGMCAFGVLPAIMFSGAMLLLASRRTRRRVRTR